MDEEADGNETLLALLMGALLTQLRNSPGLLTAIGAVPSLPGPLPSSTPAPHAVSVAEAAELLGISRALAYDLVHSGELPSVRLGRRIVVPRIALEQLLASATQRIYAAAGSRARLHDG